MPQMSCQSPGCHIEYCLTQNGHTYNGFLTACGEDMLWSNNQASTFLLGNGNGVNTVYAEFRTVDNGYILSYPSNTSITLNTVAPVAYLNSPIGLPGEAASGQSPPGQIQYLNLGGWTSITFGVSVGATTTISAGEGLEVTQLCGIPGQPSTSCGGGPFWGWTNQVPALYVSLQAVDDAGNVTVATPPAYGLSDGQTFVQFGGSGGSLLSLECYPPDNPPGSYPAGVTSVPCTVLADATSDIPGDPVSGSATNSEGMPVNFSGYADPSIRRDPFTGYTYWLNLWGTNEWMLYSHPQFWTTCPYNGGCMSGTLNTGVTEIHLAGSNTSTGMPGGINWSAFCGTGGTQCSSSNPVVPIWPTEPFCSSSVLTPNGSVTCAASCPIFSTCFSSHEVANFWPVPYYPSSTQESWVAAHLEYLLTPGQLITEGPRAATGCIVVSLAVGGPYNLGWATGPPPSGQTFAQCPTGTSAVPTVVGPSGSSNNVGLPFDWLNSLVPATPGNPGCSSWGEPAIMVNGSTVYLALVCLMYSGGPDDITTNEGYYIFSSPLPTSSSPDATQFEWSYLSGPFQVNSLPSLPFTQNSGQPVNAVTELDWTVDSGGNIVAVLTPEYLPDGTNSGTIFQYGCMAMTFTLSGGWQDLIAFVNDATGTTTPAETSGTNGCTYDPASNNGIIIVRWTLDSPGSTTNQFYALIDTGVLP